MRITKAERLMDLVIALLHSRHYRTANWIREHVAGYDDVPGDAASASAFARMFERDKQELRDLGIPIETQSDGDGYRIRPGDFALPPFSLTAAESAALAIAARLWDTTALAGAGESALRKVLDAAADADPDEFGADSATESGGHADGPAAPRWPAAEFLQARIHTADPAFPAAFDAVRSHRVLRFDYRGVADTSPTTRTVEPWGMVNARGTWYLVGLDRDRGASRTFRLSRIVGTPTAVGRAGAVAVPPGIDLRSLVLGAPDHGDWVDALLRIRVGRADGLRRRGIVLGASAIAGYDDVRLPMPSVSDLARRVAAHGGDVIAVDPPELWHAVRSLLLGGAA